MQIELKIIINSREKDLYMRGELVLSGIIDNVDRLGFKIPELVFNIERTLNEHLPSIRVHSSIIE